MSEHRAREDSSSLTLESLLKENNLSEAQVNQHIGDQDLIELADQFDGIIEDYIEHEQFGLEPREQAHVKSRKKVSEAAKIFLSRWKQKRAQQATFKALLEILIEINKETVAQCVCKYVKTRQPSEEYSITSEHVQTRQYYPTSRALLALQAVVILVVFATYLLYRSHRPTVQSQGPDLIMTDFEQHKRDGSMWYSPPVYTHHEGYKICLGVYAGKETHIMVAVYLMRGEFDDSLEWPIRGVIHYQLVDQLNGVHHKEYVAFYDDSVPDKYRSRVMEGERAEWGWRPDQLIAQNELQSYLQNNCLKFKIVRTEHFGRDMSQRENENWYEKYSTLLKDDRHLQTHNEVQEGRTLNYHPPPQIEIVDSYLLTVYQEEYLFDWEDNGFIIYFPKNSVDPQTTCAVFIYSSLSGQYSFQVIMN